MPNSVDSQGHPLHPNLSVNLNILGGGSGGKIPTIPDSREALVGTLEAGSNALATLSTRDNTSSSVALPVMGLEGPLNSVDEV
jgi:hypothetical protein